MSERASVAICVYLKSSNSNALLQVCVEDQDGNGYRVAGPKFDGVSILLVRAELNDRDREEVRRLIDRAESETTT